jgi:hypothetical protein
MKLRADLQGVGDFMRSESLFGNLTPLLSVYSILLVRSLKQWF